MARAPSALGGTIPMAVARSLQKGWSWLGANSLGDGSWFPELARAHLPAHAARVDRGRWDRLHPGLAAEERGRREIGRVARKAAAAGALAAAGASGAEVASWFTNGLAAPVGIPAGLVAIALHAVYTALLAVDLVCDLGVIHDAPLAPDATDVVAGIFAEALHVDAAGGEVGKRVGRKLIARALATDVVPLAGVAVSAGASYRLVTAIGAAATRKLSGAAEARPAGGGERRARSLNIVR